MSNRQATAFENDSTWIAGHEFLALDTELLEEPYLSLPSTLGTKERRTIYEICVHVGLYHTGAGQKFKDRYAVVSVHPDGLDQVPNIEEAEPLDFPVSRCKPWFYRNDIGICPSPRKGITTNSYTFSPHFLSRHKVRECTRKHKAIIEDLMAYPYQCLRDDIDTFEALSNPPLFQDTFGSESEHTSILVDTADKLRECVADLASDKITELAFDVEAYNASKYKQSTCLLQLCTNLNQEYVIDVLAPGVWDEVSLLQPIFASSSLVKIGHGISGVDVPCLHRDFGIFIVNAFDTLEAATKLRLNNHLGLAKLCKYYELPEELERHSILKELYQTCDWRERPLTNDQVEYSVMDVRYLIQLRRLLIRDMLEFDAVPDVVTEGFESKMSPLKLSRETSVNGHSVLGGVDSMDVEVDIEVDVVEEEDNTEDNDDNEVDDEEGSEMVEAAKSREEDENSFFTAHDDNDGKSISTIGSKTSSEVRYNQTVMDVLKISQQKCLSLWTEKKEPADKNETLLHMMKRADRLGDISDSKRKKMWNKEDYWLYMELVEWREDAAKKIGIMPSLLCPLNLLVMVAYKRPGSLISLRRLNYFLPTIFQMESHSHHLEDLFSVVAGAGAENNTLVNGDAVVRLYSERQVSKRAVVLMAESDDEEVSINVEILAEVQNDWWGDEEVDEDDHKDAPEIIEVSRSRTSIYAKITLTAAVATIGVFWIGVLKRKK